MLDKEDFQIIAVYIVVAVAACTVVYFTAPVIVSTLIL